MSFAQTLRSGRFVLTTEVTPPASLNRADLVEKVKPLVGLADAVNLTDGAAARAAMDPLAAAAILLSEGVEPIMQLTCRDRNRIALQSAIMGAGAIGVSAFLFLTGDSPKNGDQPDTPAVYDLKSNELVATAKAIAGGMLPNGRKISGTADFVVAAADAPVDPKPDWKPTSLLGKIEAGADFAQTQFCMDIGVVERYIAHLHAQGVPEDFPFLIGVAPLASAKSARWIKENLFGSIIPDAFVDRLEAAAEPKSEGAAICVETIVALSKVKGVAGAHVMAPLNEAALPGVLAKAREALGG
jgi:methylenetetrahydrofolate reductase (NADPH)